MGVDPAAPIAGSVQGILTIEPGVTFFGSSGADFLLVNRGSQLFAEGGFKKLSKDAVDCWSAKLILESWFDNHSA